MNKNEPVFARNSDKEQYKFAHFIEYNSINKLYHCLVVDDTMRTYTVETFVECLPYKGNEHLLKDSKFPEPFFNPCKCKNFPVFHKIFGNQTVVRIYCENCETFIVANINNSFTEDKLHKMWDELHPIEDKG